MAPYKTWYIVALGILALGLNNSFTQNRTSFADRLAAIGQRVTRNALQQLASAEVMLTGHDVKRAPAPEFARVQVAIARHQAEFARMQSQFARVEAQRAAAVAIQQCRRTVARLPAPPRTEN